MDEKTREYLATKNESTRKIYRRAFDLFNEYTEKKLLERN